MKHNSVEWQLLTVLVIDDSKTTRELIRSMLHEIGVKHTFQANSGEQALGPKRPSLELADLVICDWNLPGLSGLEVLKHVRSFSSVKAFLMVTARCDIASIVAARDAGVSGYISKPFSITRLKTQIETVLAPKNAPQNHSGNVRG